MDWDKLRIFHAVANAGSFTHAGETLNLSQSAVSRQISSLEDDLQTPLFHRHARGLTLTEQGELLHRTTQDVTARIKSAEQLLVESGDKPRGPLSVTASIGLGSFWLSPLIGEFNDVYPDIELNLVLTDAELDLSRGEVDVALRPRAPIQPDLIHRRLMTVHYHVYASPAYIERRRAPQSVEAIKDHPIIGYGENVPAPLQAVNWLLEVGREGRPPRQPAVNINHVYGVLRAVESGAGIAVLPDYIAANNANLVRIMENVGGPTFETHFVYAEPLRNSKRVAVFRDFLLSKIRGWRY